MVVGTSEEGGNIVVGRALERREVGKRERQVAREGEVERMEVDAYDQQQC